VSIKPAVATALVAMPLMVAAAGQNDAVPDFARSRDEALRIAQELIRIDTSNPPGNETQAANYLKALLYKEGIPSEIIASDPARANLVARLKGNGTKRPVLLLGHTDVVGVEREKWTVEPFAGDVKDGYLYGRGASDDKGRLVALLQAFILIHRQRVPLDRDLIFVAEAGEEGASNIGTDFLVAKHWDKIDAEFALNEGGWTFERDGQVQYVGVASTEKVGRRIQLRASGTSGHGSMPRRDNAIVHLASAVARIGAFQPKMKLNDTTRAFFERLATVSPPDEAFLFRNLQSPTIGRQVEDKVYDLNIMYNSMLRTSISATIIKGGFRGNVIPAEAEATLDVRALPDEDMDAFVADLRRIVDDPAVEFVLADPRPAPPPSRIDSEMFLSLERAQKHVFPKAVTLPVMLPAGTTSPRLRAKGVQTYGINTVVSIEERSRIHGNDERISVEGYGRFIELVYRAVTDVVRAR
jgi:acetylornithine deacetylase/succinyl-diaminopimelate desuccinylase-like protein